MSGAPFSLFVGPASATAPGYMTTGTQSIAGNKTFTGTVDVTGAITGASVNGVTGSPATGWTATKTDGGGSVAELVWTFAISGHTGSLTVVNSTGSAGLFSPELAGIGPSSSVRASLTLSGEITAANDTGTTPVMILDARRVTPAAVSVRPTHAFRNNGASILDMLPLNSGANMAMSWGAQTGASPAVTGVTGATRSAGTRLMLLKNDNASTTDYAIGLGSFNLWNSIPGNSSTYRFAWFGAATEIASLRGDGLLTTTGGRVIKTRSATTTPVTVVAGTDEAIFCNVAASAAVAITLPANVAGQRFTFKDAIGTANVGNITITPTAGLIDGAATLVINTAYGKAELVGDGTNWFTV